jgi:hypothetical protein
MPAPQDASSSSGASCNLQLILPHPVFPALRRTPWLAGQGRETIYAYLQALLENTMQLTSIRRGYPVWNQLNVNDSPVGFMHVEGGRASNRYGFPPVYQDAVTFWVGLVQPSLDPKSVDQTGLLNLRDVLEKAFLSDQGDQHVSTMRGRVISLWVVQDFYQESQSVGSWTSFVSRFEVRYLSAFNR